jgi:hypothetical protein
MDIIRRKKLLTTKKDGNVGVCVGVCGVGVVCDNTAVAMQGAKVPRACVALPAGLLGLL